MFHRVVPSRLRSQLSHRQSLASDWKLRVHDGWLQHVVRPIYMPLISSNTLTAHTDKRVPRVTGRNAAASAHHCIKASGCRFRCSTRIMLPAKQRAGVATTISIHNKGVADQSIFNPLVAKYSQAATNQSPEQRINATESAALET